LVSHADYDKLIQLNEKIDGGTKNSLLTILAGMIALLILQVMFH